MAALPVVVIPARGGSKRIPRKNLRPFLGVPIIQRTIHTVAESGIADRVVVSTDDDEIATLSLDAGAEVPFVRPATLADDHTATAPVVRHAIEELESVGSARLDDVGAVYATAALLTPDDLRQAADRYLGSGPDLLFAAAEHPAPIERSWLVSDDGAATMRWPDHRLTRTQDLATSFYDVGWFYFAGRRYWDSGGSPAVRVELQVIDRLRAVDIDTEEDWLAAERVAEVG